jgi:hypothetical protein
MEFLKGLLKDPKVKVALTALAGAIAAYVGAHFGFLPTM